MGFRQLYIKEAKKLSVSDNCLRIDKGQDQQLISFPLEDLDLIFVEDPNVVITARLLSEISDFGISIIFCGKNYLPASITTPINSHYLQSNLLERQIGLLPSKKNKFWETIIKAKISNQMAVLEATTNQSEIYLHLKDYVQQVKFGDEKNMEGIAAREYFRGVFGEDFIRFSNSPISSALNYGYSVITGAVIRSVAFAGLNDNLGIWHHGAQNANNLSCDLVEPFRPIVDYFVYSHLNSLAIPLPMEIRKGMVNLLNYYVMIDDKKYQVSYAINLLVDAFVDYLKNGDIGRVRMPSFFVNEASANE